MKRKKKTGELEMFKEIWSIKPKHFCQNCSRELPKWLHPIFFSHILPKGKFPEHRLNKDNIKIVCGECHQLWEFSTLDKLKDYKLTEAQWGLIEKYNYLRYCKLKGV